MGFVLRLWQLRYVEFLGLRALVIYRERMYSRGTAHPEGVEWVFTHAFPVGLRSPKTRTIGTIGGLQMEGCKWKVMVSVLGVSRFGSSGSVLDFLHRGSSLSLRSFGRVGSSVSVLGASRIPRDRSGSKPLPTQNCTFSGRVVDVSV